MPFIEYTFYNTNTKRNETVDFCNYQLHLKKFGFEWADAELEFLYAVKMSTDKKKLIRKMKLEKTTKKFSRVWNISVPTINKEKLISYMFEYFYTDRVTDKTYANKITNFTSFANSQKNNRMRRISSRSPDIIAKTVFYNPKLAPSTILHVQLLDKIDLIEGRLAYLPVPRYFHDRHDTSSMKNLNLKSQSSIFGQK